MGVPIYFAAGGLAWVGALAVSRVRRMTRGSQGVGVGGAKLFIYGV